MQEYNLLTMLLTPHVLTGLAIAYKVPYPWLSLPIAMISHQFLDLIPHDDFGTKGENGLMDNGKARLFVNGTLRLNWRHAIIFGDALLALSATIFFAIKFNNPLLYFAAAGLSIWSDILRAPYFLLGWKKKFFRIAHEIDYERCHNQEKGAWGKAVQIAVAIVALAILFNSFPWLD